MNEPYRVAEDLWVLPSHFSVPGVGILPINAFVLTGEEPLLIDAGLARESGEFLEALGSIIDPGKLKGIWLTHDDSDHTGSLQKLMGLAQEATLFTHAFVALRMSASWPLPLDRVHALIAGETVEAGGRALVATRPALFDNPYSVGLHEAASRTLFSVDAFGAFLPRESSEARGFSDAELGQGMTTWATSDTPWVALVEKQKFAERLENVRALDPDLILSSHLPAARGMADRLLPVLARLPEASAPPDPDHEAFRQVAAALTGAFTTRWRS